MRKALLIAASCLLASIVIAQSQKSQSQTEKPALNVKPIFHPLNVKTGYWESTMNTQSNGPMPVPPDMQARLAQMTPQQRAMLESLMKGENMALAAPKTMTSKSCWTAKDLQKDPLYEDRCTWTGLTSTGTQLDGKGTCWMDKAKQMRVNAKMHIAVVDSEHIKGTVQMILSSDGRSMTTYYDLTAKYLGPVCGKNESNMKLTATP